MNDEETRPGRCSGTDYFLSSSKTNKYMEITIQRIVERDYFWRRNSRTGSSAQGQIF
jgi:hypothetical protein